MKKLQKRIYNIEVEVMGALRGGNFPKNYFLGGW